MDDKTKNKMVGNIIVGAFISGGMGLLVAIFMSEPWHSYIGMIIGFAMGRAGISMWFMNKKKKVTSF